MSNILEVKNLKVTFKTPNGTLCAVRDISFSLEAGQTVAIVGESGCGKSVTSKAIMGLLSRNARIAGGEILFEGKDLLRLGEKQMCKVCGEQIAMVFQDPMSSLNPIVKVGKQITETLILRKMCNKKEAKKIATDLLREVGIPEPDRAMEKYPFEFSGGQRQRIVIAIALSANPKLLICDEPTTALDVTIQAQILELLGRLKKERGLSMIFITHDLGVVANIADKICVMYAGKIVEYGNCDEIFYDAKHPYTWALLCSTPHPSSKEKLDAIPGSPPDLINPPQGDAFAPRNKYALKIDYEKEPPCFLVSPTHGACTWLLHPNAPHIEVPSVLRERIRNRAGGQDGK